MVRSRKTRGRGQPKKPQSTLDTHVVRQTRLTTPLPSDSENLSDKDKQMPDVSSEDSDSGVSSDSQSKTSNENTEEAQMEESLSDNAPASTEEVTRHPNQKRPSIPKEVAASQDQVTNSISQVKKVNPSSRNRRVCNRILSQDRDTTPERQNTRTYQHTFKTRVTVKLTLSTVGDMHQSIRDALKGLLSALTKADSTITLMPWLSHSNSKELHRPEEIPHLINSMRGYANKLYVPGEGNNRVIYPHIRLGHDDSLEELKEKVGDWMRETNSGIFYKMLQVEEGTEVGWLLYSTREMDAGALADEIEDILGFPVGLKWKVIDMGIRGKLTESQKVQALTVEVEAKHQWKYQRTLAQFYCRSIKETKEYPNGLRLRFVKRKNDAINVKEKGKIDALRRRQQLFLKGIRSTTSFDINQIDYSSNGGTEPTLRQMIMDIKQSNTNAPLFHGVDLDWKGDAYNFQYHSKMKDEAECIINTLIPYLTHYHPTVEVEKYFTEEAVFRNEGLQFDPTTNMVTDHLMSEIDVEGIEDLPGFDIDESAEPEPTAFEREVKTFMPGDDDSVSTLGIRFTPQKRARPPPYDHTAVIADNKKDNDSQSEPSSIGNTKDFANIDSKINAIENKLEAQEQKLNQQYSEILKILQSVGPHITASTLQNSQSSGDVQNSGFSNDPGAGL